MWRNYLKTVFRDLRRNKLYWIVNTFGLALGVGVTLLVYRYVSYEFSYDQFYKHKDELYRIQADIKFGDQESTTIRSSYLLASALKESVPQVALAAGVQSAQFTIKHQQNKIYRQPMHFAHPDIIKILELKFVEGDAERGLDAPNSFIITENLALKVFGKSTEIVGSIVEINEHFNGKTQVQITGVIADLPDNSHFQSEGFVSMSTLNARNFAWALTNCETYVRANPNSDLSTLQNELQSIIEDYPINGNSTFRSTLALEAYAISDIHLSGDPVQMGKGNKKIIFSFLAFGLLVLVIACANYMNLAAARYVQKSKQVGIRKVIGASKSQIALQAITESLVIAILSVFLGGFLSEMGSIVFQNITDKAITIGFVKEPILVLVFFVFTILIAILSNLYPAFQLSRIKVAAALKGQLSVGKRGKRFRQAVVAVQFVISGGLIMATLIINAQMRFVNSKDLGYETEDIWVVALPEDSTKAAVFKQQLISNPNIISTGLSTVPSGGFRHTRNLSGQSEPGEQQVVNTSYLQVDSEYLNVMNFKILEGRNFDDVSSPLQAVVNESWVKLMGWANPLEHTVGIYNYRTENTDRHAQVIGVVKDFHQLNLYNDVAPVVFLPLDIFPNRQHFLHLKLNPQTFSETTAFVKETFETIENDQIYSGYLLQDTIDKAYSLIRTQDQINFILASLSIVVACMGLLGLAFFSVKTRNKEIAIRKVLGSSIFKLIKVLSKEFVRILILACLITFPIVSHFMNQWLDQFAYHIKIGPGILIVSFLATASITFLTMIYQFFRTARINPAQILKDE